MQVLVNSDLHMDLTERVQGVLEGRLERFEESITRIEVALSDLNSRKRGERDKRCIMEARLGGREPIAVSHEAATLTEAIHVAADRLERALEDAFCSTENTVGPTPPQLPGSGISSSQ
jgi:ribosome-associated translation inhibitor RaiA